MTRLERTYALFGGLVASIVLAGTFAQVDLTRVATSFGVVAVLVAGALLVENRDVA